MQPTLVTWVLIVFGVVTLMPLVWVPLAMLIRPDSQQTRDLIIGKGENWRDKTHFKMALGAARADWLFFAPL